MRPVAFFEPEGQLALRDHFTGGCRAGMPVGRLLSMGPSGEAVMVDRPLRTEAQARAERIK